VRGDLTAAYDGQCVTIRQYGFIDIPACTGVTLASENGGAVVRMAGRWGDELGGTGVFPARVSDSPGNPGDPANYERNTLFDNHYHDCDEYWILYQGCGKAVSEGALFDVGPGDCVATKCGDHHDFPMVYEEVTAVYFETTLSGKKRLDHLWIHKHGAPSPSV
jgi:hypothetical protein